MRGLCRSDFTSSTSLWLTLAIGTGSGITRCLSVSYARQQMKPGLVRMCRCLPVPCITCALCKNGCRLLDETHPVMSHCMHANSAGRLCSVNLWRAGAFESSCCHEENCAGMQYNSSFDSILMN